MSVMTAELTPNTKRTGGYCNAHPEAPLALLKRGDPKRLGLTFVVEVSVCSICKDLHPDFDTRKFKFEFWLYKDAKEIAHFEQGFFTPNEGRNWLKTLEKTLPQNLGSLRAFHFVKDDTLCKLRLEVWDELLDTVERYWVDRETYDNLFE